MVFEWVWCLFSWVVGMVSFVVVIFYLLFFWRMWWFYLFIFLEW